MKDLISYQSFHDKLPTVADNFTIGIRKAIKIFDAIKSFEDIERVFFLGRGLSMSTYASYLTSVRLFYHWSGGKHPLNVIPADIEQFYDDLLRGYKTEEKRYDPVDIDTAHQRIKGLKRFFKGVEEIVPGWSSPFSYMDEKLIKKLNRTMKGNRINSTLSSDEVKKLINWLSIDITIQGRRDYALAFMLFTSGLRAAELVSLRWKNLECNNGTWYAYFIGKGSKKAEQELFTPAVEACVSYFRSHFKRDPGPEDSLFYTFNRYPGDKPRPLSYTVLYRRIKEIGKEAVNQRVLNRNIDITPHTTRRSYATSLYEKGMKLKGIQRLTRHASIETLTNHYIRDDTPASSYLQRMFV